MSSQFSRRFLVVALVFLGAAGDLALASESPETRSDLTVATGFVAGQLEYKDVNDQDDKAGFGGVPIVVMLNRDWSARVGGSLRIGTLLDLKNSQLIRQGAGFAAHVRLLGGARALMTGTDDGRAMLGSARFVSRNSRELSLILGIGIENFSAANKDATVKVSGAIFENRAGLLWRQSLSGGSDLTFEISSTVFTLPVSVDRLAARSIDLLLGWRGQL